jgi:rhodanese-related sulfurtransferase
MEPRIAYDSRTEIQLLDVRERHEWDAGHIEGADHIPMGRLQARQDDIATDRKVVCVCRSGARSGRVARALRRAGYDAENMDGGMKAWRRAGLPIHAEDGGEGRVA